MPMLASGSQPFLPCSVRLAGWCYHETLNKCFKAGQPYCNFGKYGDCAAGGYKCYV